MKTRTLHPETERRIEARLAKMTLAQKAGQMVQAERMAITPEEVAKFHIGSVLSGGGSCPGNNRLQDWVDMNDSYWAASRQAGDGHWGIPTLYAVDAIHGNNNVTGATVFPHNIGLGAAGDPDLVERVARATAREILASGLDWTFAPTLAVARNVQWGRTYESYSESPDLVATYACAFVRGMQGDLGEDGVIACAKHWVGDGGTTAGIDQGNTCLEEQELQSLHLSPYLSALDAGVMSVMVSFNAWNGDKCHGHAYLIGYLLKQQLDFNGIVISDWDGIDYLSDSYAEAVLMGARAGIDMFMVSENWKPFIRHLIQHATTGALPMSRIDDAVRRILRVKFHYGLFDKPRPGERPWSGHRCFGGSEHRRLAREAVRKSLVLLKNEGKTLPLTAGDAILVAGRNADNLGHQCGGFTLSWQGTPGNDHIVGGTSIWEAIRKVAPRAELSVDGSAADPARHDVAVLVVGESPYAEGMGDIRTGDEVIVEAGSRIRGALKVLEPYGASMLLADLHPEDVALIEAIGKKGIPVVTLLISGRPLVTNRELEASRAFVAAWLPGSEGRGLTDVLFGDFDFAGRLSFSWPRSSEHTMDVGDAAYDPLFRPGYGLDYSA